MVQTALITGANSGIGFHTTRALAQKGILTVMACRNKQKGLEAKDLIKQQVPEAKLEVVELDLASLDSINAFSQKALDQGASLDILVNNAGVMAPPTRQLTSDGFEVQLGVNHLGHFLLTQKLLPLMADPTRESRIVTVSSVAHQFGFMKFDDLNSEKQYVPWGAYGQSKLANILFTYELDRRLPKDLNITANTLHPGVVNTELWRYVTPSEPKWLGDAIKGFVKDLDLPFFISPEKGAQTSIYLATSADVRNVSGKYYSNCKEEQTFPQSYDKDSAKKLWEVSLELTKSEPAVQLV